MAHRAQRAFFEAVKNQFPEHFSGTDVLEVGSLDINGTVRDFFNANSYIGVDVGPGPGVDVVMSGADYDAPDASFDVTVSAECFEHNPVWRETFLNMVRLTKDDGLVLFTCAGTGRPEHGTSRTSATDSPLTVNIGWEYYRNLAPADFDESLLGNLAAYQFYENSVTHDLYFIGSKSPYERVDLESIDWQAYAEV